MRSLSRFIFYRSVVKLRYPSWYNVAKFYDFSDTYWKRREMCSPNFPYVNFAATRIVMTTRRGSGTGRFRGHDVHTSLHRAQVPADHLVSESDRARRMQCVHFRAPSPAALEATALPSPSLPFSPPAECRAASAVMQEHGRAGQGRARQGRRRRVLKTRPVRSVAPFLSRPERHLFAARFANKTGSGAERGVVRLGLHDSSLRHATPRHATPHYVVCFSARPPGPDPMVSLPEQANTVARSPRDVLMKRCSSNNNKLSSLARLKRAISSWHG